MKRTIPFILILTITLSAFGATANTAALIGPCSPSAAYHPACDVNHDNVVDVLDIQLTAGHWNQTGAWTGGDGWALTGNAGTDPATNFLGATDGQNLIIQPGAGRVGVGTTSPTNGKLQVEGGSGTGLYATSSGAEAVLGEAATAFFAGVKGTNSASNGIGVRGEANASGSVGVWGQSNANTGVYGLSTSGIAVWGQSTSGVSIKAESTYNDGVHVTSGGTGVYVLSSFLDGMAVGSAGSDGLHVYSAYFNGVYANTTQPSGQWGFYTPDHIFGTVGMFSAVSLVAQVSGPDSLTPGDLVAVAGRADPLPGSTAAMPLVRLAAGASAGIVGVVEHRLAFTSRPSRPAPEGDQAPAEQAAPELRNADGPAQAGDYVAITVFGAAQATVADGESAIAAGTRLTAAVGGGVRPLGTIKVQLADGRGAADLAESAPVVGVALEPAQNGLVWVLVNPQ